MISLPQKLQWRPTLNLLRLNPRRIHRRSLYQFSSAFFPQREHRLICMQRKRIFFNFPLNVRLLTNQVADESVKPGPRSLHFEQIDGSAQPSNNHARTTSKQLKHQKNGSPRSRFHNEVSVLHRVRDICDETKYPVGSLISKQNYIKAKTLFHTIITKAHALVQGSDVRKVNQSNGVVKRPLENYTYVDVTADTINAAMRLLVRICREPWSVTQNMVNEVATSGGTLQSCVRFCKPRYTNLLFNTWKNASLQNKKVLSAVEVTQLLQQISSNSFLRYDFATIGMVLQVALQQSPKSIAPEVVQHIWTVLEQPELDATLSSSETVTKRVLYFYNALLKAHAESGKDFDEVLRLMYDLLSDMRDCRNVPPDTVSYNILLRFIGRNCLHLEKFEFAFQMMQLDKVQPDLSTLYEAVYIYTKFEQLSNSEEFFRRMREVLATASDTDAQSNPRKYHSDVGLVALAAKGVMNLYLTLFKKCKTATGRREMVDKAHALFLDLNRQNNIVPGASAQYLFRIMMELYALAGKPKAAKSILLQIKNPSVDLYGFMIRAYGEADKIPLAMDAFYTMIKDPRITPNIDTFNIMLNACAESSLTKPDVADRALVILKLLETNYRCTQLKLKPDAVTYNSYLKCLTKSLHLNVSEQAESLLDEMDLLAQTDRSFQPSKITYNLAVRIALRVKDQKRVDSFMERMQKANIFADTRLFNAILNHYAQIGCTENARRAETLLIDMIEMGKSNIDIRPNVYSFNIVLNAWARSEDPVSRHRMWIIYLNMTSQKIELDEVSYSTLILHFLQADNGLYKAEKLLLSMESSLNDADCIIRPEFLLYSNAVKAYIRFDDLEKATEMLFRAIDVFNKGKLQGGPTASIYHQLALAWVKKGAVERASDVVCKIHGLYTQGKIPAPPNVNTFTLVYDAWKKSSHVDYEFHRANIKKILDSQATNPAQPTDQK